ISTQPARYARCATCNEAYFPVHTLSPCGHDGEPTLHEFDAPGEVHSWTRSHSGGSSTLIAMADFMGGEIRVTAPVPGADSIAIGDRLTVRNTADGGFVLAPVG